MTIFLDARPDVAYTYSMPTATEVARVITAIRAHLGPQVLRPDWRKRRPADAVASWGCCYVAAEAAYHALGGEKWPFCPATAEHGRMVPYEPATPEQAFCIEGGGRWLKCTRCTSSIIEQGSALTAFLATFKKSA